MDGWHYEKLYDSMSIRQGKLLMNKRNYEPLLTLEFMKSRREGVFQKKTF